MRQVILLLSLSFLFSCAENPRFQVLNAAGEPVAGVTVELVAIDDAGETLSILDTRITNSDGNLQFNFSGEPGASLVVRALLPSGELRAFATEQSGTRRIDPLSEALVRSIILVTETENGRTLTDFTSDEIQSLGEQARSELEDLTVDDQSDLATLTLTLIGRVGRDIADAAGGKMTASPLATIEAPNVVTNGPTIDSQPGSCGQDHELILGNLFYFDIQRDGSLCNIESENGSLIDAFDTGFSLQVIDLNFGTKNYFPGDEGTNITTSNPTVTTEDNREIVFGPVDDESGVIRVTRKIYIPEGKDVARYLEVFENIGENSFEVSLRVSGALGLDNPRLITSQGESTSLDENTLYGAFIPTLVNTDKPSVGFVMGGNGGEEQIDQALFPPESGISNPFSFTWQNVTLEPGEKKVFAYFSVISASQIAETLKSQLESLYSDPDLTGLSVSELNALKNFPISVGNVEGEAGSVASFALLTVTGADGDNAIVRANSDGSFKAAISGESGETVQVVGEDGTNVSVTVESN